MGRELCRCQLLTVSASGSISPDLLVITHPAALVSNSRYKRFLRNRFGRSWLWVTILYCGDASFWGVLKSVVDFLHKHISNDGVGIPPDQRWVWVCRHLPIGQGIAEDVEVTVAVPDCRALANSALKDRLKVTAVNAQKVLFMCSPP